MCSESKPTVVTIVEQCACTYTTSITSSNCDSFWFN